MVVQYKFKSPRPAFPDPDLSIHWIPDSSAQYYTEYKSISGWHNRTEKGTKFTYICISFKRLSNSHAEEEAAIAPEITQKECEILLAIFKDITAQWVSVDSLCSSSLLIIKEIVNALHVPNVRLLINHDQCDKYDQNDLNIISDIVRLPHVNTAEIAVLDLQMSSMIYPPPKIPGTVLRV